MRSTAVHTVHMYNYNPFTAKGEQGFCCFLVVRRRGGGVAVVLFVLLLLLLE